ncbi:villin-2-like isoform X2 [Wolffia australiana]
MSSTTKNLDPAFQGVGQKIGTEVWRIENFQPVPLPKSDYGKFYSGDSYIILQTSAGKGGAFLYDIHFWIGKDTSQDEAGTAAIKTVELDAILGGRGIQYRELQGYESDKFLSYFKPCIIPLEGGVSSGFKKVEIEKFETRLYVCKGKRIIRVKQVPFARSSLNHDDIFILDTENKIYQFNGANSNMQERAKALEVIQYLKETYHDGKCDVAIVDDGKLVAESDSGEFWLLFGGFAPIGKKAVNQDDVVLERTTAKLYSFKGDQLSLEDAPLCKETLENNKCYLLDCGAEIFLWVGRVTSLEDRKVASQAAEVFISKQGRPKSTRVTRVIQGFESYSFKSIFESWSIVSGLLVEEEGRGKVAALLKQQGVDLKGATRSIPITETTPPLLPISGKLQVWRINCKAKTAIPAENYGKIFGGDCYIVLYSYHSGERKEDYFLACWIGYESTQDDQTAAFELACGMCNSLKNRPTQGCIFQGKEPPQFIALFQPMVVFKGGLSSSFKNSITERDVKDETYTPDGIALFQVSGTSIHNNKVRQVDAVGTSLNSNDCFLLQSGSSLFVWHGLSSNVEQQQWASKVAEFLKPGLAIKYAKEGTESSAFWFALGGKQSYSSEKILDDIVRDPHLYTFQLNKGKFKVDEVFNFTQDDLLTEDILVLDTHAEVFVWVGQLVDPKEKRKALDIGQKYIEFATSVEGLSPHVPLFKVTEGNEPCFFTTYFVWDSAKAIAQGNSFMKKLSVLFGLGSQKSETNDKSNDPRSGPTQRASAMVALTTAFNPSSGPKTSATRPVSSSQASQRAAAVAALSNVLTAEKISSDSVPRLSRASSPDTATSGPGEIQTEKSSAEVIGEWAVSIGLASEPAQDSPKINENGAECTFSYERLKAKSTNPAKGVDYKRREAYLSDAEFQSVMGLSKEAFYRQPKWKQDMQKKKMDLF